MIPDYQSIMLPLLTAIRDGKEYHSRDLIEMMAEKFQVSDS
jgi:restriction endonuclease Mrr